MFPRLRRPSDLNIVSYASLDDGSSQDGLIILFVAWQIGSYMLVIKKTWPINKKSISLRLLHPVKQLKLEY